MFLPERSGFGLNELLDPTYFLVGPFFWAKALPAADLESLDVRPSLNVFDAAVAAADVVVLPGVFRWASALPAADLDAFPVDELDSVFDALVAAALDVTSFFAMRTSPVGSNA